MNCKGGSWSWVLVVLAMVITSYCPAAFRMKRSVPVYKLSNHVQGNNSVEKDKDEFFNTFWKQQNGGLCQFGQVLQRNNTVCCVITVCGPGEEIEECRFNRGEDKCSKCKQEFIQMNNISSLNMTEAKCFLQVRDHEDCPIGDMKPARNNLSDNFPLPCECKFEKCYIEDEVGSCNKVAECKAGFQMNRTNGNCDPCPWYAYKKVSGCQSCTNNLTLLRQGKPGGLFIPPNMRTTTAAAKDNTVQYSPENEPLVVQGNTQTNTQNSPPWNLIVLVIIAVAVIVVAITRVHSYYRKRMSRPSDYVPPTPSTEPLLQDMMNTEPAEGQYGNGDLNCSMNGGPRAGIENGGVICATPRMLDDYRRDKARTQMEFQRTRNLGLSNRNVGTFEASISDHVAIGGVSENVPCSGDRLMANSEGHQESCANAKSTSEVGAKRLGEKKEHTKPSTVSIHGNKFQDCMIFIGKTGRRKDCKGNTSKKEVHLDNLRNISGSGSFEMSQSDIDNITNSGYSSGSVSSSTLKQPDRRAVNSDKEIDEIGNVNNEPPCRPELTDGACGTGMYNIAAPRREVKFNTKELKSEKEGLGTETEQELSGGDDDWKVPGETRRAEHADLPGSPEIRGAAPFQRSTSKERPVGRVQPLRPNSEYAEVRHVSGYPSERRNDESSESIGSNNYSMSYALMHYDSELNNGYMMGDIANNDDIDDDDDDDDDDDGEDIEDIHLNHARRNSPIGSELVRGGSGQMCSGLNGTGDACDLLHSRDCTDLKTSVNLDRQRCGLPQFRRDVNQTGVTHAVLPIGIREAPEGNSISCSRNENDHFISRPDIQQTERKIVADEADEDSTREKDVNSEKTKAKFVDDDCLTRFKKAKEIKECENPLCLKSCNKDSEELESTEASFEINSEEMQNMKNSQETVDKGENLAEDEKVKNIETDHSEEDDDVNCEKSFEVDSRDIANVREHETNSDIDSVMESSFEVDSRNIAHVREHETNSDIDSVMESSFDVDMKDIEEMKRACSCSSHSSVKESEASEEIARNDIDGIQAAAETSFEIDDEDNELLKT